MQSKDSHQLPGPRIEGETYRRAFDDAPIAMAIVGLDGRILRANTALTELTGRDGEELLFMEPGELAHPDDAGLTTEEMGRALDGHGDSYRLEKRWSNALGHTLWVVVSASLVRDEQGRPLYFVWHVEDGSARKRDEDRLQHLADHDALTGLANRRHLHERLGPQIARSRRYGEAAALLMLDLDGFKLVNDTTGHAAGDNVLRSVATVLTDRTRSSDVVARLGGDEFAALLLNVNGDYAQGVARELRHAIVNLESLEGAAAEIDVSIGCVLVDESVTDADDLLARADTAMYDAKNRRRDGAGDSARDAAPARPQPRRFAAQAERTPSA
jgi:diguanylate cyclase (GGDEF)-like protein/PAS domain S-box-containing protein